ncbi:MAG: aldo/keto reductase [Chloroflexi bacterium]|nr:aldo/keto reductase [Chloroflexota bacterium]
MEYRNLGRSGLEVSIVGIGCNNFGRRMDYAATEAVVGMAVDVGINFFDTADSYGGEGRSEQFLGRALKGKRHEIVVATKFASPMGEGPMRSGASRRYILQAVEDSLRRLDTDYIDLYQVHFPDPKTPLEETVRTLDDLVTSGKVRYVGNSNFAGWQIATAAKIAEHEHLEPFVTAQNQYSLLDRRIEQEVVPACEAFGLGILPYFPLASGLLTGKYHRGQPAPEGTRLAAWPMGERMLTDQNFNVVEKLDEFAQRHERSILDLAIGWLASKSSIGSVIAGATKIEQVEANAKAAAWRLSAEEMAEVDALTKR